MIYLIITSSIESKHGIQNEEHRKKRYIDSIKNVLSVIDKNIIKPIIVENNGLRKTYLDELECDVMYTDNNKLNYYHKGVNEFTDIQDVIKKYDIQDDDYVIKLTGRYKVINNVFFTTMLNNLQEYEAYIKFFNVCTYKYHENMDDCVLGLFGIKCQYIRNFICCNKKISPETEFSLHVKKNIDENKIYKIRNLGLECCFADNLRLLIC